jgi:anti-anti-sigma factor
MSTLKTIHEGEIYRLEAEGELDLSNVEELNAAIQAAFADGHSRCLLDLSRVTFIDSSVLRVLIRWANDAQLSSREAFAIIVPDRGGAVYRLFHLVGLTGFLPLFGSLAAGRTALLEGRKPRGERHLDWLTDAELVSEHDDATAASDRADERVADVEAEHQRRDDDRNE